MSKIRCLNTTKFLSLVSIALLSVFACDNYMGLKVKIHREKVHAFSCITFNGVRGALGAQNWVEIPSVK
jgi:hypothetical protein